ncbi:MAG: non-canonical purine NTP pyrophosphatase [bacterium]
MTQEIFYVTGNQGKFEEVNFFISRHSDDIVLKQYHVDLIEEQSLDQKAIALSKAMQAWHLIKKPLLIDDSGIYFERYNKFPGTLTKFVYYGIGFEGILRLVHDDPRAYFFLYLIYVDGPNSYQIFEGKCEGKIVSPAEVFTAHPQFPYDEIFVPDGSRGRTYAQMRGTQDMDTFAYRLRAAKKFLEWYKEPKG